MRTIGCRSSIGRYQNSPLADILPVQMNADDRVPIIDRVKLMVTDYGRSHPLMKLKPDAAANAKMWNDLPPLSDFNKITEAKPGAVVLAKGQPENRSNGEPVLLAYQRYGRGRTMAFTSGSSWRWQMEIPHDDQTYELFWKQVLRWLVSSSPDPVMLSTDKDTYL